MNTIFLITFSTVNIPVRFSGFARVRNSFFFYHRKSGVITDCIGQTVYSLTVPCVYISIKLPAINMPVNASFREKVGNRSAPVSRWLPAGSFFFYRYGQFDTQNWEGNSLNENSSSISLSLYVSVDSSISKSKQNKFRYLTLQFVR